MTTETIEALAHVEREIESMTTPLREVVASLDKEIERKRETIAKVQSEIGELNEARKQAARMLRLADPTFEAEQRPGPKSKRPKPPGDYYMASETMIETVKTFVESHAEFANGDGFKARDVFEHPAYDASSLSYVGNVLRVLHDRGVIRLDRKAQGGANVYKLA